MKNLSFLVIIFLSLGCSRGWKNPIESDEDLKQQPAIEQIALDAQYNIVLYLSRGYGEESNITLERKTKGGFERVNYGRLSQAALVDTSFDKELDNNFAYRVRVEKNGYRTDYSAEKSFAYVSNIINPPQGLKATILELQCIKLEWIDRSGKEVCYKIEKKNQSNGWLELATLPANSQSYCDAISGIPPLPLQLCYRIKACNSTLSSQWVEICITYSGITAPTNLRITDTTSYHFTIEWQDNSQIETGYSIERNWNGGPFKEITPLSANIVRYPDTIIDVGTYCYRVRAKKDNLYSLYSNEVCHTVKSVGLVAYYPFNGNANDKSGNANNGMVNGATLAMNRFGNTNSAYSFDGIDDYIEVPDAVSLDITSAIAIGVWIFQKDANRDGSRILDKATRGQSDGFLFDNYDGSTGRKLRFATDISNYANSTYALDRWHYVAVTWDGTVVKFYLDGIPDGIFNKTSKINANNLTLRIGGPHIEGDGAYATLFFSGIIDDIQIYNRALTEAEIQAFYRESGWGN